MDKVITCQHGLPDGVNCMVCDTDGAAESQGYTDFINKGEGNRMSIARSDKMRALVITGKDGKEVTFTDKQITFIVNFVNGATEQGHGSTARLVQQKIQAATGKAMSGLRLFCWFAYSQGLVRF